MKVSELVGVLQKCPADYEVKVLGEVEGHDLDICPSVVVMHPTNNYVALLPDYGDVESGEQVLLDESDHQGDDQGEGDEEEGDE